MRYLNITDNQLSTLPESIGNLTSLIELRLYNNQLKNLPDTIGNLKNLRELHLMNNPLTSLPDSIGKLKNLTQLDLRNNHLTVARGRAFDQGSQAGRAPAWQRVRQRARYGLARQIGGHPGPALPRP